MPLEQERQSGRNWARPVVLISLIGQIAGPGCAKVGDPLPPLSQPSPTIRSLKLVQVDDTAQLHFPLASQDVIQVQIYRQCPGGKASTEPEMLLDRGQLRRRNDGSEYLVERKLPDDEDPCGYYLRFLDSDDRLSPPSNLVRASSVKAAAAPRNLRCEVNPDHLRLEWDRPQSELRREPSGQRRRIPGQFPASCCHRSVSGPGIPLRSSPAVQCSGHQPRFRSFDSEPGQ